MRLRDIREVIRTGEVCEVRGLPNFCGTKVIVTGIEENLEKGSYHVTAYTADDKKEPLNLHIRHIAKVREANKPAPLENMSDNDKRLIEGMEEEDFEACRLLGKNSRYIFKELEKEWIAALRKTMMAYTQHSKENKMRYSNCNNKT